MKYGELQYREQHQLSQPNITIGRSRTGDWIDTLDQAHTTASQDEVTLEGEDAIAEYLESCLERFEDNQDIQAGLVALQLWTHYRAQWGRPSPAIMGEVTTQLFRDTTSSTAELSYLYLLASEISDEEAMLLRGIMYQRASQCATISDVANNRHLVAYLDAMSGEDNLSKALEQLLEMRKYQNPDSST